MNPILRENKIELRDRYEGDGCAWYTPGVHKRIEKWEIVNEPTPEIPYLINPNLSCGEKTRMIFENNLLTIDDCLDISIIILWKGALKYFPNYDELHTTILGFRDYSALYYQNMTEEFEMIELSISRTDPDRHNIKLLLEVCKRIFGFIYRREATINEQYSESIIYNIRMDTLRIANLLGNDNPIMDEI